METIHDGNLSGSNVRNHLGDEERIEFGAVFLTGQGIVARLFFECTDATDTGAEDDTRFCLNPHFRRQAQSHLPLLWLLQWHIVCTSPSCGPLCGPYIW